MTFPTTVDTFANPAPTDSQAVVSHSGQHDGANNAITAIQKILVGPSIFNVKGYGAVGNGTTDDTVAINAAITAATAGGGGIVYFPPGTFRITSEVKLPPPDTIAMDFQGAGMWLTTIKLDHATARLKISDGGGGTTVGQRGSLTGNFSINGNAKATVGLFLGLSDDRSFDNIWIYDCPGVGLNIEQLNNGSFAKIVVNNCTTGVELEYGAYGNTFWNPEIYDCGTFWKGSNLYNTRIFGGISEHFGSVGAPTFVAHVDLSTGSNSNSWTDHLFVCVTPPSASVPFVKLRDSFITHLTRCTLQGAPGLGVGIDADCPGLTAAILDRTTFNNLDCSYKLEDTTYIETIGDNPSVNVTQRFRNQGGGTNIENNLLQQRGTPGAGFAVGEHTTVTTARTKTGEFKVYDEGGNLMGYVDIKN